MRMQARTKRPVQESAKNSSLTGHSLKRAVAGVVAALAVFALVLATPAATLAKSPIVVGGKNFTEQYIVAHMVGELLKAEGFDVEVKTGIGSGEVIFNALRRGDIDLYVEYSGTAWMGFLKQELEAGVDPDALYERAVEGLREQFGLEMFPTIGFSNTYVFVVTREMAERHNLTKVSDLIPIAGQLTIAGTPTFMSDRLDGIRGVERVYGMRFRRNRGMDHSLLFQALQLRQVDVIVAFSTDGQIAALDLVTLEDDRGVFPPYHAGVLARPDVLAEHPEIRTVLSKLEGLIDERTMAELNYQVDGERKDEREVALNFLRERGLID